ncbi:ankyrin repeat domain-containing protein, partial [Acinetobacter baumannii]|uniref:ankyrin repeat domain-containing protein n=1 Tax=Acinetobacter baumannii TaxID=470 RepID=UPI003D31B77A
MNIKISNASLFVSIDALLFLLSCEFLFYIFFLFIFLFFYCSDVYELLRERKFDEFDTLMKSNAFDIVNNLRNDDNDNQTLLILACWAGHDDRTKFLMQTYGEQIDFSIRNDRGYTALHHAAERNNDDVVEMLLNIDSSS